MLNNFESGLTSGMTEDQAAANAMDISQRQKTDKDYASRVNQQTQTYLNENFNTNQKGFQKVMSELGVGGIGQSTGLNPLIVPSHGGLVSTYRNMFAMFMQQHDGDTAKAAKSTKDGINMTWGESYVNGRREFSQYPIENFVDGGTSSLPLVQADMHNQIKDNVDFNKQVYDAGLQNYYYKIEDRPSLEDYTKAKQRVRDTPWGKRDLSFRDGATIIRKMESGQPLKVTKIWRSGKTEEWQTALKNSPYQDINLETGKLNGKYDVALYNPETGVSDSFYGLYKGGEQTLSYYPNNKFIGDNFSKVTQAPIISHEQQLKKQEDYINESKENIKPVEPEQPVANPDIAGAAGKEQIGGGASSDTFQESTPANNSTSYNSAVAKIESGKKGMKAVSKTGAIGKYQFIKKTWNSLVAKHGKKMGITKDDINNEKAQDRMHEVLVKENKSALRKKLGRDAKHHEVYMAHNIGPAGAAKLIRAAQQNPDQLISKSIINSKPSNNPKFFLRGGKPVTVGEAVKRYTKEFRGVS